MICCFTGHRKIKPELLIELNNLLFSEIKRLAEEGVTEFRAGGAIGFDSFAALNVLKLKKDYPQIKLCLCLPCKNQDLYWNDVDKNIYEYILQNADSITYVSEKYFGGAMQKRNRALVDGSDICIAFLDVNRGGTAYTVAYAKEKNLKIINLKNKIKQ